MPLDPEIERYARSLIERHGKDARHIANQGRLAARQKGDKPGAQAWSLILQAMAEVLDPRPPAIEPDPDQGELRSLLGRLDRFVNLPGRGRKT